MIQVQSWLKIKDNSGGQSVKCIKTLGGFNRKLAYPGDIIIVTIKTIRFRRKVKLGEIYFAIITQASKSVSFADGSFSFSEKNVVILINNKKRTVGTRFFSWVSRRLRRKKFLRILLLCGRHIL